MRDKNKKIKKYYWLISLSITIIVSMWIYGMVRVYLPDPIDIGFGQYLDLSVGIIILTLSLSGIIVAAFLKKEKKEIK